MPRPRRLVDEDDSETDGPTFEGETLSNSPRLIRRFYRRLTRDDR